jgi:hypothetical protein
MEIDQIKINHDSDLIFQYLKVMKKHFSKFTFGTDGRKHP